MRHRSGFAVGLHWWRLCRGLGGGAVAGHWFLWWQVDPDEIDDQAKEYEELNLFQSARGVAVLCLALSIAITWGLIWVGWRGVNAWSLLDIAVMVVLGLFIWRGHRWAMLGAMLFWTIEKIVSVQNLIEDKPANAVSFVIVLIWWCFYMHAFWTAYRVERRRRQMLREYGERRTFWQALWHGLGTTALLLFLLAVFAAAGGTFVLSAMEGYNYGELGNARGKLILAGVNYSMLNLRQASLSIGNRDTVVTFVFNAKEWEHFAAIWNAAQEAKSGPLKLEGRMLEEDTGTTELSVYSGQGVRLILREDDQCARYDLTVDEFSTVDAAVHNIRRHFAGQFTGERMAIDPIDGLEQIVKDRMTSPLKPSLGC